MDSTLSDVREISKEVIDALKPLAQKLGEGAEAVYRMAVKDAYITGIESWIYVFFGIVIIFIPMVIWAFIKEKPLPVAPDHKDCPPIAAKFEGMYKEIKRQNEFWGDAFIITIAAVCFMIGVAVVCANLGSALHNTLNPEYMALQNLLSTLKH